MPERDRNIIDMLATLTGDLIAAGWDQPASQVYHLVSEGDEPVARLAGLMPHHPTQSMQAGYDAGLRVPEEADGLVVSLEGHRHLYLDELIERNTDMLTRIKDSVEKETGLPVKEEELQTTVQNYYYHRIVPSLPPAGQMPPTMRAEVRITTAVLRDATLVTYVATRDDTHPPLVDIKTLSAENQAEEEMIASFMYQFLHGLRPAQLADPVTAVDDYKTLEALSALPTTEKS